MIITYWERMDDEGEAIQCQLISAHFWILTKPLQNQECIARDFSNCEVLYTYDKMTGCHNANMPKENGFVQNL